MKETFTLTDQNGNEITYLVLFTFDSMESGKSYVVYTDNTYDEAGNMQIYASVYDPNSEELHLYPVETEREWEVIRNVMENLLTGGGEEEEGCCDKLD